MKLRVYAVLDKAVEAFLNPMIFRSEGEAKRSFVDAISAEGSQFSKHKQDYAFCLLGFYDDNLGTFDTHAPVVCMEGSTALAIAEGVPKFADLSLATSESVEVLRRELNGK